MQPKLSDVKKLAYQAGDILRAGFGQQHEVKHKGVIDLVTEVDRESENYLIEQIQGQFPGHAIITEESGYLKGENDHCWYIDPLDGTLNYAHGVPLFAVSVAYAENGEVRVGAVYDPMRDECYCAERGNGAWLNEKRIHVSDTSELIESLLVTGFPYDIRETKENNLDHFSRFSRISQGVRRLGTAAMDLVYVAAGRLDGFWELKIHPWDIAAGTLIVEEAGGVVTNIEGDKTYMKPPYSVVTANTVLHPLILEILHENHRS